MIITISGANFSASNIGTLSTWTVSKSIGAGAEHNIPSYVDKNSAFNYEITLKDGYTFGTYSVTMGGETITPTVTETSITINIASVTGAIRIEVKTINSSTGEEETSEDLFTTLSVTKEDKTMNGVTFTWNGDVCTVSGTSTGYSFTNMILMEPLEAPLTPGKAYRLDLNQTDPNIIMSVFQTTNGTSRQTKITKDGGFIIAKDASRIVIRVEVLSGMTANGTISPKLYAVPDEDADVFTLSSITTREDITSAGVTYTWNDDVCTVSGTSTGISYCNMLLMEPLESPLIPGQTYKLILNNSDSNINMTIFEKVGTTGSSTPTAFSSDGTFTYNANATRTVIRIDVPQGKTVNGTISPKMYIV